MATCYPEFISGSHFLMLIYNNYEIISKAENDVNYKFMSFYGHTINFIKKKNK